MHGKRNSKGNAPRIRIYPQIGLGAGITELNTPFRATNLPPDGSRVFAINGQVSRNLRFATQKAASLAYSSTVCNLSDPGGQHTLPRCSPALWSFTADENESGILQQAPVGIGCEVRGCK